jgi:hypothetical protein
VQHIVRLEAHSGVFIAMMDADFYLRVHPSAGNARMISSSQNYRHEHLVPDTWYLVPGRLRRFSLTSTNRFV